ncbi:MAG: tyrosine-protein phosphatase [Prevotella sp.]|jgi:protein-tyrosine phosphatase|nr:tyrosine-protein phosphatase [Prevotella sp.]
MLKLSVLNCAFGALLTLGACADATSISFSCEKDKQGNYILKWEVSPEKDNAQINIFCSDNDSIFPNEAYESRPQNDYVAVITPTKGAFRSYFMLKTGKTLSGIITNRRFEMDSIQNFRDLGGYFTDDGKQMRWGKIYRCGSLARTSKKDSAILSALRIATVIDFRDSRLQQNFPDLYDKAYHVNLPINANIYDPEVKQRIIKGSFFKGDAIIHTQDCYRNILEDYSEQFRSFFDILCDEANYPVVFHCGLGKDKTGLAAFFLLKALDIPSNVIEDDFLLSNECIDKCQLVNNEEKELSEKMQEAMTMIAKADHSQLTFAISCMKKECGSVETYMTKKLNLTAEKRNKLKKILLY